MSDDQFTTDTTADETTAADERGYPTPLLRFMPAITFGVRAAALAGMAVSAGALAFGLAGAFDDVTAGAHTTCCEDDPS
ncbi:hypothetical protein [Actinophytocola sp. NPDC049390]|uniref:hypothetical protein n=1 Tax=Actinophytocola sp. NPDC049390 TaxID=3363894 RepID=UPI0037B0E844